MFGYCPCQFNIVTVFCAVTVHTCQKNLSCSKPIRFHCPFHGINTHINPTAVFINIPAASISTPFRVYCHDHALTSKLLCRLAYQRRIHNCGTVHGHLVRSLPQNCLKVIHRPNTAANSKRNKYLLRHPAHHINCCFTVIRRCRNVKKHHLISSCPVIRRRNLHRIARVNQIDKIDTFYHPSVMNIKARNNSLCNHDVPPAFYPY